MPGQNGGADESIIRSFLAGTSTIQTAPGVTEYTQPMAGSVSPTEGPRQIIVPLALNVTGMFVVTTSQVQPADGAYTLTLRKNGVDTALKVVIAPNTPAGTYSDVAHSIAFAQGDLLSIKLTNAATSASTFVQALSLGLN